MSGKNKSIERRRKVEMPTLPGQKTILRMPSAGAVKALFNRDAWHCRFCGCRVVPPDMRDTMRAILPGAIPLSKGDGYHGAFFAMSASVDHVVPHSASGTNEPDNLVTACWCCQFGRGHYRLAELGLMDPRLRPPIEDGWDGVTRLAGKPRATPILRRSRVTQASSEPNPSDTPPRQRKPSRLSVSEWINTCDPRSQDDFRRLVAIVESCEDLGMSCRVNKVLLVRMFVNGMVLNVFGVEPDGAVEIPWSIDCDKHVFRPFTEMLSAAVPGTVSRATEKFWRVSWPDKRRLTVGEILIASAALRYAWRRLHADVIKSESKTLAASPSAEAGADRYSAKAGKEPGA